ncbi:hypothetical protein VTK26DRAFT_7620 [Humicola hyalothermophila]
MAPGLLVDEPPQHPAPLSKRNNEDAPRHIFPDGIRTSGQHPPLYHLLQPYSAFPKHITGPTVWRREDFVDNPSRWIHPFTDAELSELSAAADAFLAASLPLTAISQSTFRLPPDGALARTLRAVRADLLDGKGFVLFRGFPADRWPRPKTAAAYMGLGAHLGYLVSQNALGHVLGHVKDVGDDPTAIDRVRIYRTSARQFFHVDDCDLVGLLCLHRAQEGGESDIVSFHHVWNVLQAEHPDVAELLTRPVWYFDRKGEVSDDDGAGEGRRQEEWIRQPVVFLEKEKASGEGRRVYCKWDPYYVRSLGRFVEKGLVPPLSAEQERAIELLEGICLREALHMVLEVGDIQFVSNAHLLHARTAYTDFAPPAPRRHLLRLWLATPEGEGGWALPMPDSHEKKRGGVQVNDTPPKAPLDAE